MGLWRKTSARIQCFFRSIGLDHVRERQGEKRNPEFLGDPSRRCSFPNPGRTLQQNRLRWVCAGRPEIRTAAPLLNQFNRPQRRRISLRQRDLVVNQTQGSRRKRQCFQFPDLNSAWHLYFLPVQFVSLPLFSVGILFIGLPRRHRRLRPRRACFPEREIRREAGGAGRIELPPLRSLRRMERFDK